MTEEVIDLINQIDTTKFITYYYGCIFIVGILLTLYIILWLTFTIITKKKQNKWLEKQSQEIQNAVRKYKNINIFTSKGNLER